MNAIVPALRTPDKDPRIFNASVVGRLKVLNELIRTLRRRGFRTLSVDVLGKRPSMLVDGKAAGLLIRTGNGCAARLLPDGGRMHSVVVDCCEIRWEEMTGPIEGNA